MKFKTLGENIVTKPLKVTEEEIRNKIEYEYDENTKKIEIKKTPIKEIIEAEEWTPVLDQKKRAEQLGIDLSTKDDQVGDTTIMGDRYQKDNYVENAEKLARTIAQQDAYIRELEKNQKQEPPKVDDKEAKNE